MDWLTAPNRRLLTPNRYDPPSTRVQPIEAVVLHFTVGGKAAATARYMANRCTDSSGNVIKAGASVHLIVGRDGDVWQLAPLSSRCWHAGSRTTRARWRGLQPNPRTVGIELSNLGPLFREDGRWVDYYGRTYRGEVFANPLPLETAGASVPSDLLRQWCEHVGVPVPSSTNGAPLEVVGWEPYPDEQLAALAWLLEHLAEQFPVLRKADEQAGELSRITRHQDVDPARKLDPGPAFPMDAIRSAVQGGSA